MLAVVLTGCSGKTTGANKITANSAVLNAVGTCDTSCSAYMRWRKTGTGSWTNAPALNVPEPATDQPFSQQAKGLTPNTSYQYQVCGKEDSQSDYVCVGPDGNGNTVDTFTTKVQRQPTGFSQSIVFEGLTQPTNLAFSPDGRVFVAEKSGVIKVFDSLNDTTPTEFADLRTEVNNFWDRGLLGLALDPKFPQQPYVYVLYTYDAPIGGTAPTWGASDETSDPCPSPPGPTTDGCLVSGRLSQLTASGDTMTGPEKVLINDWCGQFPGHTVGDLKFGSGGALYVSGGEAAGATSAIDYGQHKNACGDPPVPVGGNQRPPTAEGGALRAQSLRRPAGEPRTLDGTIVRVDPKTGKGLPSNPLASSPDANERRVVAYGLRNPFRFATRPNSKELWIGDVGWTSVEEVNRLPDPTAGVTNFGWPCYEGDDPQPSYQAAGLDICEGLYSEPGAVTPPYFSYHHNTKVISNETCPAGTSSISGMAFYTRGPYPPRYNGALFFADYSRDCIWAMQRGNTGDPSPNRVGTFLAGAANPVDLQVGPGGDLYYVDLIGGTIRRIPFTNGNRPPNALAKASRTWGNLPLSVDFDATGSTDPEGDNMSYAWDLDGDGAFDDSTDSHPSFTYTSAGVYHVALRVRDSLGNTATDTIDISAGNTPPSVTIDAPTSSLTWAVGDQIDFSGSATDAQDGTLPDSALSWSLIIHHCPSNCHTHTLESFTGPSGSFSGPDHEYPAYLELRVKAIDSGGLTRARSVKLDPKTVDLTLASVPAGLTLTLDDVTGPAPITRTVIQGSANTVTAPDSQTLDGTTYDFRSWSDGRARTHSIKANASNTYTATYDPR